VILEAAFCFVGEGVAREKRKGHREKEGGGNGFSISAEGG